MVGCSSHYITYINENSFYATAQSEPLPVNHEYSWRKARWAPRCKACRLWTGGGPQLAGRGHIVSPRAPLVCIVNTIALSNMCVIRRYVLCALLQNLYVQVHCGKCLKMHCLSAGKHCNLVHVGPWKVLETVSRCLYESRGWNAV